MFVSFSDIKWRDIAVCVRVGEAVREFFVCEEVRASSKSRGKAEQRWVSFCFSKFSRVM